MKISIENKMYIYIVEHILYLSIHVYIYYEKLNLKLAVCHAI